MKKKAKVLGAKKADRNHAVVLIEGGEGYRKKPCDECPWRSDLPTGVFPPEAFRISAHTSYDMADTTFACHMQGKENPATCAGFLLRSDHNLAVRMALANGKLKPLEEPGVPLYDSYRQMAEANGVAPDDPILERSR